MKRLYPSSLITLLAFGVGACQPDEEPPQALTSESTAEIVWDWSSYQTSSELLLGQSTVDVQPKQSFEITSEGSGILTLDVEEKLSLVQEGDVIAQMDVDNLAEQEERLNIQEQKRFLEDMRNEKLDLPEKKKQAKAELKEAQRKVKLMAMILRNPVMQEASSELYGAELGPVSQEALKEAQDVLDLAERKVAWAEKFDGEIRDGEQRIIEMDLSKSKRTLEDAKERSVYTIPFDGELRLEVNFIEGQKEYTVNAREVIATLNDYEEIHAHLNIINAEWVNLHPQRLYLQLADREKTIMPFLEDTVKKDKRTQREVRQYIYAVPLEHNEGLKRLAGTQMSAELIYKLPSPCHIVPKYDLSLYALGKTNTLNWSEMVEQLWPGAKVLAQGRKDIAIQYAAH